MARLTEGAVSKITVPDGKRDILIFDEALPGFGVRAFSSGRRSYFVKYNIGSQQRKITLGPVVAGMLTEMRKEASKILAQAHLGTDVQANKTAAIAKKSVTVGLLIERYLLARKPEFRPRSFVEVKRHLEKLFSSLHGRAIETLNRRDIVEVVDQIADQNGRVQADRAKASFGTFLGWCIERDYIDSNAAMGIKRRSPNGARSRVLTEPELIAIWRATDELTSYNIIVRLLLLSGQRREEIGGLMWDEINFEQRQIELPASRVKNGKAHLIPLSDQALALIHTHAQDPHRDFVFGIGAGPFSGWSKSKERLDGRLGSAVAPWTLHDLRRTFATLASDLDLAPPHAIEMALNHWSGSKAGIAAIYNRAKYERERRVLMERWAAHVEGLVHAAQA